MDIALHILGVALVVFVSLDDVRRVRLPERLRALGIGDFPQSAVLRALSGRSLAAREPLSW